MTSQRELDRLLGAYFDDGRDELADRVIDAALDQIDHTHQRRVLRVPWRFPTMFIPVRLGAAALIGVLALGGMMLVFSGGSRPSVTVPTPTSTSDRQRGTAPAARRRPHGGSPAAPRLDRGNEGPAVQLPDGRVLLIGGITPAAVALSDVELYDPATGTWRPTGSMATPRMYPTATVLADGKVLVAGGSTREGATAAAELYDPATRHVDGHRLHDRATRAGVRRQVGRRQGPGRRRQRGRHRGDGRDLRPGHGTWAATGNMTGARSGPLSAVLLADGRVLAMGGFTADGQSAEIYDPATGTWSATGRMPTALGDEQSGTRLADGSVLVAGGNPSSRGALRPRHRHVDGDRPAGRDVHQPDRSRAVAGRVACSWSGVAGATTATAQVFDSGHLDLGRGRRPDPGTVRAIGVATARWHRPGGDLVDDRSRRNAGVRGVRRLGGP